MEQKITPTPSQVQVLMSDWLGNLRMKDEGSFTHKGSGGIRRSRSQGGFSDYLISSLDGLSQPELIKTARQASCRVVNSIVPEPTDVFVGGAGSYQAEGDGRKVINLATDYFDDGSLYPREKVEIMLGLATHEAAHATFTEPEGFLEMIRKEPPQTAGLKKDIWNIIEDERIEYLLGDERPGLADVLGRTKDYYFKKLSRKIRSEGKLPKEPLPRLLATLTQAVRYPSELTEEDILENFGELDAIRKALTPYPLTSDDVLKATDKVMDIVRDLAKKQLEDQKKEQGNQQNAPQGSGQKQDPSRGDGKSGQDGSPSGTGGTPQEQDVQPTEQEILQAIEQAMNTAEGKAVTAAVRADEQKHSPDNKARCCSPSSRQSEDVCRFINEDDSECTGAGPGNPRIFVFRPKGSADSYNDALLPVKAYIPAMSKALSCKSQESEYALRGLPSGKLNTNKFAAFRSGNRNIFDKQGRVTCSAASVCILLDESGSMSGRKLHCARSASVLINEAVARIGNVNFYCYGYTDDRLNVYSENGRTSRWSLGATEARGGTPTGMAMAMAAARIRRFSSDPVLLLVLTDGAADNSAEVIRQDEQLRKDRFHPVGIGICSNSVSRTFRENVVIEDLSTFALNLGRLTKGKLSKMLVRKEENQN